MITIRSCFQERTKRNGICVFDAKPSANQSYFVKQIAAFVSRYNVLIHQYASCDTLCYVVGQDLDNAVKPV